MSLTLTVRHVLNCCLEDGITELGETERKWLDYMDQTGIKSTDPVPLSKAIREMNLNADEAFELLGFCGEPTPDPVARDIGWEVARRAVLRAIASVEATLPEWKAAHPEDTDLEEALKLARESIYERGRLSLIATAAGHLSIKSTRGYYALKATQAVLWESFHSAYLTTYVANLVILSLVDREEEKVAERHRQLQDLLELLDANTEHV